MSSHVYLFRHCVRSTDNHDALLQYAMSRRPHDGSSSSSEKKKSSSSSSSRAPLPAWNTPTNWCTERSMDIIRGTGAWLAKTLAARHQFPMMDEGNGKKKKKTLRVRLVSDAMHRDVDTTLALARGMAQVETSSRGGIVVMDIDRTTYDPTLFGPLEANNYTSEIPCRFNNKSNTSMNRDIQRRWRQIPTPSLLTESLAVVESLGGQRLSNTPGQSTKKERNLNIQLIVTYAQMMFYSRASGVDPPFMPNATLKQVYQMIQWMWWSHSVMFTNNVEAAMRGAFLMASIVEALEPQEEEDTVTIFVGHDADMNHVATVLGLEWKLRPPYECASAEYRPTPPGSGMHFAIERRDDSKKHVEMSYVYPVFLREGQPLNTTGILEATPLLLTDPQEDDDEFHTTSDATTTYLEGGTAALERRVQSILKQYSGAKECYDAGRKHSHLSLGSKGANKAANSDRSTIWGLTSLTFIVAVSVMLSVIFLFVAFFIKKKVAEKCTARTGSKYKKCKLGDLHDLGVLETMT